MFNLKKMLALLLVVAMVAALFVGCKKTDNTETQAPTTAPTTAPSDNEETTPATDTPTEPVDEGPTDGNYERPDTWARAEDEDIFNAVLADYEAMLDEAETHEDLNERFVAFGKAEAFLLSTGVMAPYQTQGGVYRIGYMAYRTTPYAMWGNDDDRLFSYVAANELIKKEDYAEMKEMWTKAAAGEGTYDAAAYLTSKGYTLRDELDTTFSTAPVTIDWLNTSSQSDTEITVNCVDGLVQYDNLGAMQPALAESWEMSDDGLTYTFHIRQGVKWFTAEGTEYADVTAKDFEAGFHHMLDAAAGLEWLVDGKIAGVTEYLSEGGSWDDVGYKATDDYTLVVTLVKPLPYFMTMLTYSCFLPICDSFYQSRGGAYGIDEYAAASQDSGYSFGLSTDVSSQVYCGPFLLQKLQKDSEILAVKNPNYYKADQVTLKAIKWVYDDGSNPIGLYNQVLNGNLIGIGLSEGSGTLAEAKKDGNFDKYAYVTETTSTSYFGGLNLNRGTFELKSGGCKSPQTEEQKISTHIALNNQSFRLALQYAWDHEAMNAVAVGKDLGAASLRNMYTAPEFVRLTADVTDADGHTFTNGTVYGDIVQYYVTEVYKMPIDVADSTNGWYRPDDAKAMMDRAVIELGDAVNYPINIDVVYLGTSANNTNMAKVYKQSLEGVLGADKVQVNLIEATTTEDFYACGYRAPDGISGNYDMFYGSGWGPDYGDPSTYLDTFRGLGAGYMCKVIGVF